MESRIAHSFKTHHLTLEESKRLRDAIKNGKARPKVEIKELPEYKRKNDITEK